MVFHPAIIALLVGSVLISAMLCYSAYYGVRILKSWNIRSGSELQLSLERRTYLISTMMTYAFGFQLVSLFLFIYTADHLHTLFIGAMCAAGSLNVNEFGYPTVILKTVNFILAGLWLIINFTDNRGYDYPLVKKKYLLLLLITPGIVAETIVQGKYFLGLEPDVITSCCGALFSVNAEGVTSGIVSLPVLPVSASFYASMALTLALGVYFYFKGQGAYLFSVANSVTFMVSIIALISYISIYIYELPTHHCPFDILQAEYNFLGYPLYASLFGSAVTGMGVGVIMPFKKIMSLRQVIPTVQRGLAVAALILSTIFLSMAVYGVASSNLTLALF
ncbi:MAG: hypothetical protein JSW39_04480 [Desulfobacterales bacterium]|nr:MAG: hypothetical protein JSW39_04480 [Desulfobacterales bacterium]